MTPSQDYREAVASAVVAAIETFEPNTPEAIPVEDWRRGVADLAADAIIKLQVGEGWRA